MATWFALVTVIVAACTEPPDATERFDIDDFVDGECSSADDWLEELA